MSLTPSQKFTIHDVNTFCVCPTVQAKNTSMDDLCFVIIYHQRNVVLCSAYEKKRKKEKDIQIDMCSKFIVVHCLQYFFYTLFTVICIVHIYFTFVQFILSKKKLNSKHSLIHERTNPHISTYKYFPQIFSQNAQKLTVSQRQQQQQQQRKKKSNRIECSFCSLLNIIHNIIFFAKVVSSNLLYIHIHLVFSLL